MRRARPPLHMLAEAFLAAPPPRRPHDDLWFPGRRRQATPGLTFTSRTVARGGNRTAVLDAVLDAISHCMATNVVDLWLTGHTEGELVPDYRTPYVLLAPVIGQGH
jgi:hypothetical protein